MTEIKNAQIREAFLGIEDHGIIGVGLTFNFGGIVQGTGTHFVEGMDMRGLLAALFTVTNTTRWEQLTGRFVRVEFDDRDQIAKIGHIVNDEWMAFSDFHKKAA